jgi:hypothetical protein
LTCISEILDIQGENPFKIRAYTKGSQDMEDLTHQLSSQKLVYRPRTEGHILRPIPGLFILWVCHCQVSGFPNAKGGIECPDNLEPPYMFRAFPG